MAEDSLPNSVYTAALPDPSSLAMETRNVLNNGGQTIGQLSLPVGTAESIWAAKISQYALIVGPYVPADSINSLVLTGSGAVTTSSGTPSLVPGMTTKPAPGAYLVFFNGSASTNGANASGSFGLYKDGVLLTETKRDISCQLQLLGGLVSISLNTIAVGTYSGGKITVDGTNTIELKYLSANGGTIGFSDRTMMLIRVS